MPINLELFHLGNDVVRISKKIEEELPSSLIRNNIMEILNLVNQMRLAIQNKDDPKRWWNIEVKCTSQELLSIKEQMEVLEMDYTLTTKDQT